MCRAVIQFGIFHRVKLQCHDSPVSVDLRDSERLHFNHIQGRAAAELLTCLWSNRTVDEQLGL